MSVVIDGTSGITFPAGGTGNPAGAVVGTTDTQSLTNKTIGSGYAGSTITLGTAQASTSGTAILFTGIPSWAKRVTVIFNETSVSGTTANLFVQLGTSGGIATSGYISTSNSVNGANGTSAISNTTAFGVNISGTNNFSGTMVFTLLGSNLWVSTFLGKASSTNSTFGGGTITLSGTLDRVNITTSTGTDTFDNGSINIMYE